MIKHTEVMKLALEALKSCDAAHITDGGRQWYDEKLVDKAVEAIEKALTSVPDWASEAIEQPAQQVGTIGHIGTGKTTLTGAIAPILAAQQQEPVAWMYQCSADSSGPVLMQNKRDWAESSSGLWTETPLYKSPPTQRKPLTDEEIKSVIQSIDPAEEYLPRALQQFARAIEAAHGITKGGAA